jgi:hypothetical protein
MQDIQALNNKGDRLITWCFLTILFTFFVISIVIATHLKTGIAPDEIDHFLFSEHFAKTIGIPADSATTQAVGWYIKDNHFLYHWINGRVLNILNFFSPKASEQTRLIVLRITSSVYSSLTIVFCYLTSKLIIKNKYLSLLPPFLLSNTLMFVLISGAVSYDNMANMFSMGGIYFLLRTLYRQQFWKSSFLAGTFLSLGMLTKYTITPLALFSFIAWLVSLTKSPRVEKLSCQSIKRLAPFIGLFLIPSIFSAFLYGGNFLKYGSLTPECNDLFAKKICAESPYYKRYEQFALDKKLDISLTSTDEYPGIIKYALRIWPELLLQGTVTIVSHLSFVPLLTMRVFKGALMVLALLFLSTFKRSSTDSKIILGIVISYMLVLFVKNYNSELVYGFKHFAVQGRYTFPVIGLAYILIVYYIFLLSNKYLRLIFALGLSIMFICAGPLNFILFYQDVFIHWITSSL